MRCRLISETECEGSGKKEDELRKVLASHHKSTHKENYVTMVNGMIGNIPKLS
jgi:predicted small metal-binding protein